MTRPSPSQRGALACVAAALMLTGCGLQEVGVQGVVTAGSAGQGVGDGSGLPGGALPTPGASVGPDGTVVPGSGGGFVGGGSSGGGGFTGGGGGGFVGGSGGSGGTGGSGSGGQGGGSTETPGLSGTVTGSYVAVTGFDQLSQVVPVSTASTGDSQAQVNAMVKWVNSHGGIGGRRLVGKLHSYNAMSASTDNDNKLCAAIRDDDKAAFAVLHGQIHYEARGCYKNAKILAFEGGQYGWSEDFYRSHSPYLWAPSFSSYDDALRALVSSAKRRGWIDAIPKQASGGRKVGVISWSDSPYTQLRDKVLIPALKAAGVDTVVTAEVSSADVGSIARDLQAAAVKMNSENTDHLMFVGSNPLQPFFVQQAGRNSRTPFVYAFTTFDTPRYMAVSFSGQLSGAIGVGGNAVTDVLDPQYPFPQTGMEKTCVDIYKSQGVTIPARYRSKSDDDPGFDAKQALSYCELTLLYKTAGDRLGRSFTNAQWAAAAEQLGTSLQMGLGSYGTRLGPGRHWGGVAYRDLVYNSGCTCMTYIGPTRSFE